MENRNKKGQFLKGIVPWIAGRKHSDESRDKIRAKRKVQQNVTPIKKFQHLAVAKNTGSVRTQEQIERIRVGHLGIRPSLLAIQKSRQRFTGSNNPRWKGGITTLNAKIRHSSEYKKWRQTVFERDGFKCIGCGSGGYLHADHIKPFALFPDLRLEVSNGRTLCVSCHKKTPTYKNRWISKEQYEKSI